MCLRASAALMLVPPDLSATTISISKCTSWWRRIGKPAVGDDVVGVLLEEERWVLGVSAHLAGVLGVVAAHAIDAVDREELVGALDGECWLRSGVEDIGHERGLCWCIRCCISELPRHRQVPLCRLPVSETPACNNAQVIERISGLDVAFGGCRKGMVSHARAASRLAPRRCCNLDDFPATRGGDCPVGRRRSAQGGRYGHGQWPWPCTAPIGVAFGKPSSPRHVVDERRHKQRATGGSRDAQHIEPPIRGGLPTPQAPAIAPLSPQLPTQFSHGRNDRLRQPGPVPWCLVGEPGDFGSERTRRRRQELGRLHGILGARDAHDEGRMAGSVQATMQEFPTVLR